MHFDDREHGHFLLETIDLDAQLLAIRAMLRRNRNADEQLYQDIKDLDARARQAKGAHADHLVDLTVDEMHRSVYQSAATSAAAVGALAPLLESFFVEIFGSYREQYGTQLSTGLAPTRPVTENYDPWNPYFYFGSHGPRPEVGLGIIQLAAATGLAQHLPPDHREVIEALFLYRNKMLHRSFEWPLTERHAFQRVVAEKRWPAAWFSQATSGGEPWVIYMTDEFIDRCITFLDQLLEGAGAYSQTLFQQKHRSTDDTPAAAASDEVGG